MKPSLNLLIIPFAASAIVALAGTSGQKSGSCCGGMASMQHGPHHAGKPVLAKQLKAKQTATVLIDGGYKPGAIEVRQGKPLELTFTGGKNLGCGGVVVLESLKIGKEVATGKSVVVKFTPKAKGEIPFTCGMGMLRGKIIVK